MNMDVVGVQEVSPGYEFVAENPAVPVGYKQTEVGVIPEDWEPVRIDQYAVIKTGGKNTQDKIEDGLFPFFVRSQQVERINSYSYDGEAVLTAGDGVGTGKIFHYINGKFDVHQRVYRISEFSSELDGRYFFYQFSSHFYDRIMSLTAKSSVDSVRMEMIAGMQIALPPTPEQRAIATALSDVDALLEELDRLIAKKRDIKQAVMQQLLTGETRLPGFEGEWVTLQIGDLGRVVTGGTPSTKNPSFWGGVHPWITPTDIGETRDIYHGERSLTTLGLNELRALPENSILVTCIASVGKIAILKNSGACNQQINAITPNENYDANFIYYLLLHNKEKIKARAGTTATPIVSRSSFEGIELSFPPGKAEQQAISQHLSCIDNEIDTLRRRRSKTAELKQGMMQELLTGRTRLV